MRPFRSVLTKRTRPNHGLQPTAAGRDSEPPPLKPRRQAATDSFDEAVIAGASRDGGLTHEALSHPLLRTSFLRAETRSTSGTLRSVESMRRSFSVNRASRFIERATGVFGFLVNAATTL